MREIKFRAWYNQNNEMINWDEIKECVRNIEWDDFMADCELMQYTGLKDKNGVDIYEGDIVTALMDYGPAGFIQRTVCITWNNLNGYYWNCFDIDSVEVIGNIHQNSELLK